MGRLHMRRALLRGDSDSVCFNGDVHTYTPLLCCANKTQKAFSPAQRRAATRSVARV